MRNKQKTKKRGFTPPTNAKRVRGFTVIEMMVSLGIFTIVLSVSVGALLSMVSSNRKTQSLRSAMDNLNLAMEEMSRNITQGRKYHCGANDFSYPVLNIEDELSCSSGKEKFLAIENHDGDLSNDADQIVYKLDSGTGRLQKSINSGQDFKDVTAPSINIDHLKFYVFDNDAPDEVPHIVITIGGVAGTKDNIQSSFNIQTMVTQRAPE